MHTTRESSEKIIQSYYDAFNRKDFKSFLDLLDDNILHDINQGGTEKGKTAFEKFLERMEKCYDETIDHIVIMSNTDGSRVASEYRVQGKYTSTDGTLPDAKGQTYTLPGGAFFEVKDGKITRVTNYYNVKKWLELVK